LHNFVEKACNGELDTRAAAEEDGDEYDRMQEIEVDDGTHPRSRGVGYTDSKRARYQKNKAKNRFVTVTAPAVTPDEDPMSTGTRIIQLHVVDRKQVWLDLDDVEWALRVLYMQFVLKGVPVVSPDDAGPFLTPRSAKPMTHGDGEARSPFPLMVMGRKGRPFHVTNHCPLGVAIYVH